METSIFQEMIDRWPSPWVARTEIERFTGGVISEKYLANLDSAGKGPAGSFHVGRKRVYPTKNLAAWLQSRATPITDRRAK